MTPPPSATSLFILWTLPESTLTAYAQHGPLVAYTPDGPFGLSSLVSAAPLAVLATLLYDPQVIQHREIPFMGKLTSIAPAALVAGWRGVRMGPLVRLVEAHLLACTEQVALAAYPRDTQWN